MKKMIFAAVMALCLLAGTSAYAQCGETEQCRMKMTVEQIAQKKADRMAEALKLDEKQTKEIYDYTLEQVKQMQNQRAEMKQCRQAEKDKMKTILTPEQYSRWEQMHGSKSGQGMRHGKPCAAKCDKAKSCDKPCAAKCDKAKSCDKPCAVKCDKAKSCDKPCAVKCDTEKMQKK